MGRSAVPLHAGPSRVRPPKTGSSGSSALAPATISTSAPSRRSAVSVSATTRGEPPAYWIGNRRPPNHAIFCVSAVSNRARCLASRRSCATTPIVVGLKPCTATSPCAARAIFSTAASVSAGMTSGVTFALADRLARLDGLRFEQREDRDAFQRVDVGERLAPHAQEAPARRGERPLTSGVALHLDAVAHDHRGQPLAGFLLVQVGGLDDEQVNLFPRRLQQDLRAGRR